MAQQAERHARGLCHCGILDMGMALGIIFTFLSPGFAPDLSAYLFGNILTITFGDIALLGGLAVLLILFFSFFLHPIIYVAFDREFARSQGIPVQTFEYVLMMFIALTIVACLRMVGIVLVISLLTIPQMTANLFSHRFHRIHLAVCGHRLPQLPGRTAHFILSQCSFGSSHHLLLHYYLCNL